MNEACCFTKDGEKMHTELLCFSLLSLNSTLLVGIAPTEWLMIIIYCLTYAASRKSIILMNYMLYFSQPIQHVNFFVPLCRVITLIIYKQQLKPIRSHFKACSKRKENPLLLDSNDSIASLEHNFNCVGYTNMYQFRS